MPKKKQSTSASGNVGALIRTQREAVGMTIAQVAKQLGISRNTITNYESGKTEPTASDLVKLAQALGCSIRDLLAGAEEAMPPSRFAFRSHKKLREDPAIAVMARKYLKAYTEIEEITQARPTGELGHWELNSDMPPKKWIETVAAELRRNCKFLDSGPENIARTLESIGVRCLFFDKAIKGLDGLSVIQGKMRLILLQNRKKGIERTIFSAAHELGHLVLHPDLFTQTEAETDSRRDYEEEADLFAGCFLVPTDELICIWHEEHLGRLPIVDALLLLKRVFHVSFWCLLQRVSQIKLTQVERPMLVNQVKRHLGLALDEKAKMEDLEPELLPPDALYRSTRFERLVRSAFIQEKIGVAKVAELLQITVDEAKECTTDWLRPPNELVE